MTHETPILEKDMADNLVPPENSIRLTNWLAPGLQG